MNSIYPPVHLVPLGYYELSTHLLALEASARSLPIRWFNKACFETTIAGEKIVFWCTRSNANSAVAVKIATRKDMTAKILRAAGLQVAEGKAFSDLEKADSYAKKLGYPVVTKPLSGMKGRGVTVDITDRDQFRRAWEVAAGPSGRRRVLVERSFRGIEARFLVVGGACVGVVKKVPPNVVGDGISSIQELIDQKNALRAENPHLRSRPILIDNHRQGVIRAAGYTLDDVLSPQSYFEFDRKGAFSTGGDSVEIRTDIHPTYLAVAEQAAEAFPGLGIAGIDVMVRDFQAPIDDNGYIVVEVNSMPALGAHHFPWLGQPSNAAGAILDLFGAPSAKRQWGIRRASTVQGGRRLLSRFRAQVR